MNTKICARKGCDDAAKHKISNSIYCDKHYVWHQKVNTAKAKNKTIPSIEEFDRLWEGLVGNGFRCQVCNNKMVVKVNKGESLRRVVSLQHWDDGRRDLICLSCNSSHGNSKLGDKWKNIPEGFKCCSKCGGTKKIQKDFHKNPSCSDGFNSSCKQCYRDRPEQNKNRQRKYNKLYREKNKDKIKEHKKAYREKNKDKIKNYQEDYYKKNKEKLKIYIKAWYEKNKKKS